jgi:hypothetical protein
MLPPESSHKHKKQGLLSIFSSPPKGQHGDVSKNISRCARKICQIMLIAQANWSLCPRSAKQDKGMDDFLTKTA